MPTARSRRARVRRQLRYRQIDSRIRDALGVVARAPFPNPASSPGALACVPLTHHTGEPLNEFVLALLVAPRGRNARRWVRGCSALGTADGVARAPAPANASPLPGSARRRGPDL